MIEDLSSASLVRNPGIVAADGGDAVADLHDCRKAGPSVRQLESAPRSRSSLCPLISPPQRLNSTRQRNEAWRWIPAQGRADPGERMGGGMCRAAWLIWPGGTVRRMPPGWIGLPLAFVSALVTNTA
jgi:hypothetical protein